MKRLYTLLILCGLFGFASPAIAQDPAFSQYYNTPFQTNPAMMSFRPDFVVGANFRSQWSGLDVPFTTFQISGYYPILSKNKLTQYGAAGGFVLTDRQPKGKINTTMIGVGGAYKLPVNYANYFHFGIQAAYLGRSLNSDGLTTGSQVNNGYFDPSLSTRENLGQTRSTATIGLGTSWINEDVNGDIRGQLGVSVFNINAPNISFNGGTADNLYRTFVFTGSVRALRAPTFSIYPGVRYMLQGPATKLNVGALARFKIGGNPYGSQNAVEPGSFGVGVFYQANDASAVIGTAEFVQPQYAVSVNYDFGTGMLRSDGKQANAAEIFLCYKKTIGKRRKVDLRFYNTKKKNQDSLPTQQTSPDPQTPKSEPEQPQQ